jgi:hypothetical protein
MLFFPMLGQLSNPNKTNPSHPLADRKMSAHFMKKLILILLLIGSNAMADLYRVHYSIRGSGRDITINAESSAEARRVVMDMFHGAVVTGAHKIRK